MKTVFGTVIYKQARDFLSDLLDCIKKQTDKDFDVLIVNDNYTNEELAEAGVLDRQYEKQELSTEIKALAANAHFLNLQPRHVTIAQTRIEMIREAKRLGYDLLIVSDADDTFAPTKVAEYKKAYEMDKSYAFYYNELVTDEGTTVLENMPEVVTSAKAISQSNFIGMSIAAINLNMIDDEFIDSLSEGDCPVFDWYFYTRMLMDIGPGKLVRNAATIYRIHENNQVGTTHDVDQEYRVKLTHYENLAKRYPYFKHLYKDLRDLDITKIDTSQSHNGYWWSNIIMEDSYEI